MGSYLFPKDEGVFNPLRRFAFTNITDDLFTFHWDGKPISVKAHDTIELPHHLMVIATTKLVDKIMIQKAKEDEIEGRKTDRFYRGANMMGVPDARKVYEDQIVRELEVDEESPQIAVMKAQIRDQVLADIENGSKKAEPVSSIVAGVKLENFASVDNVAKKAVEKPVEFAAAKKSKKK